MVGTPYIPDYWDDETIITSVSNQNLNYGQEHPAMFHPSLVSIPVIQTCVLPWIETTDRTQINHKVLDPFCGGLNTFKSLQWINEFYGTKLQFIGYDVKKYF